MVTVQDIHVYKEAEQEIFPVSLLFFVTGRSPIISLSSLSETRYCH